MKNILKSLVCIVVCISMIAAFAGCSSKAKLTEDNVTYTVEHVEQALKDFDTKELAKYVDSPTLNSILTVSTRHEQFGTLGKAIFAKMHMEIESIDLEAQTVTVKVTSYDLSGVATAFVSSLTEQYSKVQLLTNLDSQSFLDSSLGELLPQIDAAGIQLENTVTLTIKQDKHNLVLGFDEAAEDAVSGGALVAIKNLFV